MISHEITLNLSWDSCHVTGTLAMKYKTFSMSAGLPVSMHTNNKKYMQCVA